MGVSHLKLGTCGDFNFNISNNENWFYLHVLLHKYVWGVYMPGPEVVYFYRHFGLKIFFVKTLAEAPQTPNAQLCSPANFLFSPNFSTRNQTVVIKKLAHNHELRLADTNICRASGKCVCVCVLCVSGCGCVCVCLVSFNNFTFSSIA